MRWLARVAGLLAFSCGGAGAATVVAPVPIAIETPPPRVAHAGHLRFSLPAGWQEHSGIVRERRVRGGRLRLWAMESEGECSEREFIGTEGVAQRNPHGTLVVTGWFLGAVPADRVLCIGGTAERHVLVLGRIFEAATAEQLRASWESFIATLRPEDGESARAAMARLEVGWEVAGVMRFLPPDIEPHEARGIVVYHHRAGLPDPAGEGAQHETIAGGYEVVRTAPGAEGHDWTAAIRPGLAVSVTLAAEEQAERAAWELFLRTVRVVDPADEPR